MRRVMKINGDIALEFCERQKSSGSLNAQRKSELEPWKLKKNLSNFDITMMLITEHCKFFILNGNTRTEVLGSDFAYLKPNGAFVCTKNTVLF